VVAFIIASAVVVGLLGTMALLEWICDARLCPP
jgi:hypothetical protein